MHTFEIYEEYYDWEQLKGDSDAEVHLLSYGGEDPPNMYQPQEPLIAKSYLNDIRKTRREYKRLLWMDINNVNGVPKPVTLYEEAGAYMFYLALPGVDAQAFLKHQDEKTTAETLKQIGRYLSFFHKQKVEECPFDHRNGLLDEDPVFSHGDFRLSNVIVNENYITGSVDMVGIGIRDRYYDIVSMALDIEEKLGEGYVESFYEGYRIKDQVEKGKFEQFEKLIVNK
ncbi:phosphotransferase [Salinicoccus siamensis]|uniref:Phosphotransferase n=1 Tax=Salinicoccus siamensis TaxID=381830 RepID=A0ABV5Z367_9STAP